MFGTRAEFFDAPTNMARGQRSRPSEAAEWISIAYVAVGISGGGNMRISAGHSTGNARFNRISLSRSIAGSSLPSAAASPSFSFRPDSTVL
jgi:hypothetical protein